MIAAKGNVVTLVLALHVRLPSAAANKLLWLFSRRAASSNALGRISDEIEQYRGQTTETLHPEGYRHLPEQPLSGTYRYCVCLRSLMFITFIKLNLCWS